jgi:hypothetical protein
VERSVEILDSKDESEVVRRKFGIFLKGRFVAQALSIPTAHLELSHLQRRIAPKNRLTSFY